jgi:hypothetical protein
MRGRNEPSHDPHLSDTTHEAASLYLRISCLHCFVTYATSSINGNHQPSSVIIIIIIIMVMMIMMIIILIITISTHPCRKASAPRLRTSALAARTGSASSRPPFGESGPWLPGSSWQYFRQNLRGFRVQI